MPNGAGTRYQTLSISNAITNGHTGILLLHNSHKILIKSRLVDSEAYGWLSFSDGILADQWSMIHGFNQPIYALRGPPWPRSRVRSLPHPVEFWTCPALPYETKTFLVPVHPCYVDNNNLSQMGASLVPEGVTAEEGSQRVMPWGYLVYR